MATVLADMRARLTRWMARADAPLLRSEPAPAPIGAQINDPDDISPRETSQVIP